LRSAQCVEPDPLRNSAPVEACLMDDGSDPVARNLQGFDPVKHAFPNSTATFLSELPVLCQRRLLPVAAAPGGHEKIAAGTHRRRLLSRLRGTAQLLLDRLAQVLQQMEAVGDLPSLWRALARAISIEASAVPANDLNLGMPPEPFGGGGRRAIRQHVDHLTPLQVYDDRPVAAALSPAPVIDAGHPERSGFATLSLMAFELPQNGVVALWQTETRHQPLRRPPSGSMTDQLSEFAHPPGSSGKRLGDPRKQVGKGLTLASSVAASPPTQLDAERDGYPLDRQILQVPHIPAVARRR
jgi:hypothetical protein